MRNGIWATLAAIGFFASGQAASADAWSLCGESDPEQSIAGCTKVLSRGAKETPSGRSIAHYNRGRAYKEKGDLTRAIADYDQAIRLNPDDADAYAHRGFALTLKHELARARADYDQAIRLKPGLAESYTNRGIAFRAKGDLTSAIASYDQAILLKPDLATAFYNRGIAFGQTGDLTRAIADYDQALHLKPDLASAYYNRGTDYESKGDLTKARADFVRYCELAPGDVDGQTALDGIDKKLAGLAAGSPPVPRPVDEATQSQTPSPALPLQAQAPPPRETDQPVSTASAAHYDRGNAHLQKGDLSRAIAEYDQALGLNPNFANAYFYRGIAYERLGELKKARVDLARFHGLAPDNFAGNSVIERVDKKLADLAPSPLATRPVDKAKPLPVAPPALNLSSEKRVALVIGNSRYTTANALPNPSQDAAAVAEELRGDGFAVTSLVDGTRAQMIASLRAFRAEADNADWAVVYYAGHGMEMGGKNYLVPIDARLDSDRDIDDEAVALSRAESAIEGAHRLRLVILDACRNNPFLARMLRTASLSRSVERGFARVEPRAGTLIVFAAKEGETADDGEGAHSPFTTALLAEMRKPGLEIRRLFDSVRDDVLDATKNRQMPFSYGSLSSRHDFYFVNAGKEKR